MKIYVNKLYNVEFKDIEDRKYDINLKGSELIKRIQHFFDYPDLVNVIFGFNIIEFNYISLVSVNKITLYFKEV